MTEGSAQLPGSLVPLVTGVLGPVVEVVDLSWSDGESLVLAVIAASGREAIVKRHRDPAKHRAEVDTYQAIGDSLGDRAPRLLGHDAATGTLVLSRLPGALPRGFDPEDGQLHHEAGRLLRALHDAVPPVALTGWRHLLSERLEKWIGRAPDGLLTAGEIATCRAAVDAVGDLEPPGVLTHGDWQRRNWLVDGRGTIRGIDFEHARRECWLLDVQKLWWGDWQRAPGLRYAFLTGYDPTGGRPVDPLAFRALAAVQLLSTVVWSASHRAPGPVADARAGLASIGGW